MLCFNAYTVRIAGELIIERGRVFSWADDVMFYHQSRGLRQVVGELQTEIDHISAAKWNSGQPK